MPRLKGSASCQHCEKKKKIYSKVCFQKIGSRKKFWNGGQGSICRSLGLTVVFEVFS